MSKQAPTTTITNLDKKIERDKIIARINELKKELEVTIFGVSKEKKYLKNLKGDSTKKTKEIEKTKNKLAEAKGSLDEVKGLLKKEKEKLKALALKIEQDKKEASNKAEREFNSVLVDIKVIKGDLISLDKVKTEKTKDKEDLDKTIDGLRNQSNLLDERIKSKNVKLSEVTDAIVKGNALIKSVGPKKEELKKVNKKLVEANNKLSSVREKEKNVESNLTTLDGKVKQSKNKKAKLSSDIKKQENKLVGLRKQEQRINARNVELEKTEKRIKKMGETLQKHFDQNDMKHIKVFKK